jgi:predicted dehydrogenase
LRKIKVAVIGCGQIASSQHIKAYVAHPWAEIKYLVDIRKERADELANRYGVPHTETDFRNILEDEEVEAVSICTPNHTHAPISIACLNAGKHVLCEKPAALNMDEAIQMKEAADRNGKILNIGVVNRYNTAVNKIKEMIDHGELGRLYHIYCSFRSHRSIPGLGGPFTTKSKSGGGVLIDWGVHLLDIILYCLGDPKILTVSGATHGEMAKEMKEYAYINMWAGPPVYEGIYDVEDFVTGLIRTSGPTISFNGAWAQNIGESAMYIEFLGDKAGVKLQYGGEFKIYSAQNGTLYETQPSFSKDDMFSSEVDAFLQSAVHYVHNRSNIDQVLNTSLLLDAIYKSAESGVEVVL